MSLEMAEALSEIEEEPIASTFIEEWANEIAERIFNDE